MPRPRRPLFGNGELVPDALPRGRPTSTAKAVLGEFRQTITVRRVIELQLLGSTRAAAIEKTAREHGRSPRTVEELYLANVRDALPEVVHEFLLLERTKDAAKRGADILAGLERRQRAQAKIRRR